MLQAGAAPVLPCRESAGEYQLAPDGSDLLLGVCEMEPGERTNRWSSTPEKDAQTGEHWYGPVDETYYCIRGRLTLSWDEGDIAFGPGDAIYLAPGWHRIREASPGVFDD